MADIAKLGFAVATDGLVAARTELQKLPAAAKAAESAADGVSSALDAVNAAAQGVSTSTTATVRVINSANGNLNKQAANINEVTAAYQKLSDVQKRINALTGVSNTPTVGRAADIQAYGNALDDLRAKYNPLFAAGRDYKATLIDINNALKVGALNEKEHAAAITNTKAAFTQQVNSINKSSDATKGLSYQAQNLSYQLIDVTQGVLSGISPMQIFAQQAGQIGQALASANKGQNLFAEIGKSIMAVLTPVRLLSLGIIGLVGGFYLLTTSVLNSFKALNELSGSIDVPLAKLYKLQQAVSFKGIGADDFTQQMQQFSVAVDQANHNAGELKGLMIANGMQAKTLEQYLGNVADLVARTTSGVQKRNIIEAAGMTYTKQWADFLSQGSKGINAALAATTELNGATQALLDKQKAFNEGWAKVTNTISTEFKSAVVDAISWLDKLSKAATFGIAAALGGVAIALAPFSLIVTTLLAVAAAITAGVAALKGSSDGSTPGAKRIVINGGTTVGGPDAAAGAAPKTREQLLKENSDAQARIGILGDLATVTQQVTQKQLELNAAGLNGVGVSSEMQKKILLNTQALAEMNKVQSQASIGIYDEAAARKAATDTLQNWINHGLIDVNNAQQMAAAQNVLATSIKNTSDAAAVAASKYPQFTQAMLDAGNMSKQLDQTLTTSFNGLVSPIQDTINGVTSLKDGFNSAKMVILKAIQEMIIKMLVLKPLMSMFGGFGGGVSDLFSFFAGGGNPIKGLTGSALGDAFTGGGKVDKFANGGAFTNGIYSKPTLFSYASGSAFGEMGEAGPEAIMPLSRGPDGSLGVQMHGGGVSGGTNVSYAPVYQIGGAVTQADLNNLKASQDNDRRKFRSDVIKTIQDTRRRGGQI